MEISEAVDLIRNAAPFGDGPDTWADLGCGSGLFTYALSTLLSDGSLIHAVDKAPVRLGYQPFPGKIRVQPLQKDFTEEGLGLEQLDGILMANSLHYVREQAAFIRKMQGLLKKNGRFIMVEYDTDLSNPWVPYPLSFSTLKRLFDSAGYQLVRKLNERPSAFGRAMLYAADIQ